MSKDIWVVEEYFENDRSEEYCKDVYFDYDVALYEFYEACKRHLYDNWEYDNTIDVDEIFNIYRGYNPDPRSRKMVLPNDGFIKLYKKQNDNIKLFTSLKEEKHIIQCSDVYLNSPALRMRHIDEDTGEEEEVYVNTMYVKEGLLYVWDPLEEEYTIVLNIENIIDIENSHKKELEELIVNVRTEFLLK